MCGGRGEDEEEEREDTAEVGGGRGPEEVLKGAGRSGGGEDRVGDLLVEMAGAVVLFGPRRFSSSSSVSMAMGSGAAAVSAGRLVNVVVEMGE